MAAAPQQHQVRFPVDPRDVPPVKAARRLHLTIEEFEEKLPRLMARGFPPPDPDTGNYDLKLIDEWMDNRTTKPALTQSNQAKDAREVVRDRLSRM